MQSIASRSLPDEEVLYQKLKITVTPSWLEIRNTSYAIRYIQKLTLRTVKPPRIAASIVFFISILLTTLQAARVADDTAPIVLNWFLLALCLVLFFTSSFVAFVMQSRYQLDIVLANEPLPLQIQRATREDLLKLHEALALAMDWYRGDAESAPR